MSQWDMKFHEELKLAKARVLGGARSVKVSFLKVKNS